MSMPCGRNVIGGFLLIWVVLLIPATLAEGAENPVQFKVPVGAYTIEDTPEGQVPWVEGYGRHLVPGQPNLPARIFSIAIPPGARITDVTLDVGKPVPLPGTFQVPPVSLPRARGGMDAKFRAQEQPKFDAAFQAAYGNDDPFPAKRGEFVVQSGYRKYNLADVRISPMAYHPQSGRLVYYPDLTVNVHYQFPPVIPDYVVTEDFTVRTEARARRIVANYDQAQSWYGKSKSAAASSQYDYVIVTLSTLVKAVQPLVDWETAKGRSVKVVTTSWIFSNYNGIDLAERMRNFLVDKYPTSEWGIQDVLLAGHYDDVPMRRCAQDIGDGMPETDFYFAELSTPDYESWDIDYDQHWGEDDDPNDFYAEVNVGRIPWSDPETVKHVCEKSVRFEQNTDPAYKKNMLLLGAFFWADTDGAVLMELKSDRTWAPWMLDWTTTRMYEKNPQYYSAYDCDYELTPANAASHWAQSKYAFVNWAGHGSPESCHLAGLDTAYFIQSIDSIALNDDYPSVVCADACSNSDTDHVNIGQRLIKQGAVGFLGATKVALGILGWSHPYHGCGSSADFFFTTAFTSGEYTQGEAVQEMVQTMYQNGLFAYMKYEIFEWSSLWGVPSLTLDMQGPLTLCGLEGAPDRYRKPGQETKMTVRAVPGLEDYLDGSGKLHYRFHSDDPFTRMALTPVSPGVYEVVMPAACPGDAPEFYFSAKGTGGSTVRLPVDAPVNCYSFDVAFTEKVMEDGFEGENGWTTENENVENGEWERADPSFTAIQPGDDHSMEGFQCFVTGAAGGSIGYDDLDGGPTHLISPEMDFSDGDYDVSFYYWFHQSYYGDLQPFRIYVSDNGGTDWVQVMETFHQPGWNRVSFRVSDYVTPTSTVKVRFSAVDNPNDGAVEALVDDFKVTRLIADPTLWAEGYTVPVSTGRPVNFHLNAGPGMAAEPYLFLGCYSGTVPGTQFPGGPLLPLNWDHFTDVIVGHPNSAYFQNFKGTLDGTGRAECCLNLFRPLDPSLVGWMLSFAYLVGDPPHTASAAVNIYLVP